MITVDQLALQLSEDFPAFLFKKNNLAYWSGKEQAVYYADSPSDLLHELGHAILDHNQYEQDVEILQIEREAWDKAQEIAPNYNVVITEDMVELAMETYREWVHCRSLCPNCKQTGLQSRSTGIYRCINCKTSWQANDARTCQLKRRKVALN